MKTFIVSATLLLSTSAFARQYIQCNILDTSATDVMVINLQTSKTGTLFLTSGAQNPEDERVLVKIAFDKVIDNAHVFKVIDEANEASIAIPSEVIDKSSNWFKMDLNFGSYSAPFSCFSRIYND